MARRALVSQNPTDSSMLKPTRVSEVRLSPGAKGTSTTNNTGARTATVAKKTSKTAGAPAEKPAATVGKQSIVEAPSPERISPGADHEGNLSRAEIEQYAEEWLLYCDYQQRSPATIETRRLFLKNLLWFLDHRELDECGTLQLRQFFHYLAHGHEEVGGRWGNPKWTKPLRPISIKDYHICLRLFFDWMVQEEILPLSPMQRIEQPLVREEVKQPLSREQTEALLRAARVSQDPRRNEAILLMLFDSGVRASELLSLKVKDVDVRSGSFEVTGKGNKKRTCYTGKATVRALMAYLRRAKLSPESPLFPTVYGGVYGQEPLTRSGLLHLIKRLAKQAGIHANVHQLRRTFATSMLEAGADICSVRDMLGHTNIQMTLKYLAVSQSHIESQHRQFSPADRLRRR